MVYSENEDYRMFKKHKLNQMKMKTLMQLYILFSWYSLCTRINGYLF